MTERAREILERLQAEAGSTAGYVFQHQDGGPLKLTLLDHQQSAARALLKHPAEFVLHSLRHTFGTRLGESGADAFTIMKLMGHSSITVSQKYVHPSPESIEPAFDRFEALNERNGGSDRVEVGTIRAKSRNHEPEKDNKSFSFIKPGWRNRQTQRT